ncbi:MAG: aminopeptidase [Pseudomonadota bacterium]
MDRPLVATPRHGRSCAGRAGRLGRAFAALVACLPLTGCYLLHTAKGQLDLNAKRQPIARVVADPRTPPTLRAQLERVARIRDFATAELGLPDNGSYRSYADVGRPYVLWNVFAAPEFSVDPKTWCFPVAGCVAYRGYFDESAARRYGDSLRGRGYDVLVGGVPAYSTLGHFEDPVLNTWLGWSEPHLAGLVFHELTHQLLYVPGDSKFNEAFATVVETEGVRRWLERDGRAPDLAGFAQRQSRYAEVAAVLVRGRDRLRALYASALEPAPLREAKAAEFERMREEYRALAQAWGDGGYERLFGPDLNNASLLAVATYRQCVPGLERELEAVGRDLPRFYARARELAALPREQRRALLCGEGPVLVSAPAAAPAHPSSR